MESREGLLISIIDTATLAAGAFDQIESLVAELLDGGDLKKVCSKILHVTGETRGAVRFEQGLAEDQRSNL